MGHLLGTHKPDGYNTEEELDQERSTPDLSYEIAERIYNWMNGLASPDGSWVVNSHEFLPANVTLDWAVRCTFINHIAKIIE